MVSFSQKLKEQEIILYDIPPNTTNFLQPFDVAVFGPLKAAWRKHVREWVEAHDTNLSMVNFVSCVIPMYYKNVNKENVISVFKCTGLFPFDVTTPDYSKLRMGDTYVSNVMLLEDIDQGSLG